MVRSPLKIGNASGFWGDSFLAPSWLAAQQPDLDFLTLDYLSEVSLSIMAIQKQKDSQAGYAQDFVKTIASLVPLWQKGCSLKVVANAGGLNPKGCAKACQEVLEHAGIKKTIGIVDGDDVLEILRKNPDDPLYNNLDSQQPLRTVLDKLVTANAYLGAAPIVQALCLGAEIVITGRVADPSLTVAPCLYHYQWRTDDYQRMAGATIAGHLIECGAQATGGISTHWLEVPDKAHLGFPIVEMHEDGSFVLTKSVLSGGEVSLRTVKEQLLYEIGDPARYLSPDVTVSFLELVLECQGGNRVLIKGAAGTPPPPAYKVSATYRSGFRCDGFLALAGPDIAAKAEACGDIMRERMRLAGFTLEQCRIECVGNGALAPGVLPAGSAMTEGMVRFSAADSRYEALDCFSKEIASLVTCGPPGTTGYISGRPKIRPVFGYWPCLVSRDIKVNACLYNP
jgi:hypothetical protein